MDARSFHLLVALHVAYFPNQVNLDLSFGQTKRNFYLLAHQGHFQYDTFDTHPYQVPLASVTVEFFLIRPVSRWRRYLAWHGVELFDLPLDMTVPQLSEFHELAPNVRPRLPLDMTVPQLSEFHELAPNVRPRLWYIYLIRCSIPHISVQPSCPTCFSQCAVSGGAAHRQHRISFVTACFRMGTPASFVS